MNIKDLVGTFTVNGKNQDEESSPYKGTLVLTLDNNSRIHAEWLIDDTQSQYGTGFFKDNILVINFNYQGADTAVYKGVVIYKCITRDLLEGFWSEKHGNPLFLGEEHCIRIGIQKEVIH